MTIKNFFRSKNISSSKRVQILDNITDTTLHGASRGYKVNFDRDKLICIIDNTIFGSGADGCVIATNGIALRESFGTPKYINFNDIQEIIINKKKLIIITEGKKYEYDFHIPEEKELINVFNSLNEWLISKNNETKISHNKIIEYGMKIKKIENTLKNMIRISIEIDGNNQEVLNSFSLCIDEIEKLKRKVQEGNINNYEISIIEKTFDYLKNINEIVNDPINNEINYSLLDEEGYISGILMESIVVFTLPMVIEIKKMGEEKKLTSKISSFLSEDNDNYFLDDIITKNLTYSEENSNGLFGKKFVQKAGIGFASYHFESKNNCYINYENAPKEWVLDNKQSYPKLKKFDQIFYNERKKIFSAWIDWSYPENSSSNGASKWLYQIKFNDDFSEIKSGVIIDINNNGKILNINQFNLDLEYKILK